MGESVRVEDLVLVSVDDHVVEPPDMFEGRLPARFAEQAPRVDFRDDGTEVWRFDGKEATNIGLNAVAGRRYRRAQYQMAGSNAATLSSVLRLSFSIVSG